MVAGRESPRGSSPEWRDLRREVQVIGLTVPNG